MLNALDAIINHIDKLKEVSDGQFSCPLIIRATVGSKKPFNPGHQHTQDFTEGFKKMIKFPIYEPKTPKEVLEVYEKVKDAKEPVMIIERKELYGNED